MHSCVQSGSERSNCLCLTELKCVPKQGSTFCNVHSTTRPSHYSSKRCTSGSRAGDQNTPGWLLRLTVWRACILSKGSMSKPSHYSSEHCVSGSKARDQNI